jgi:hypothetical protein
MGTDCKFVGSDSWLEARNGGRRRPCDKGKGDGKSARLKSGAAAREPTATATAKAKQRQQQRRRQKQVPPPERRAFGMTELFRLGEVRVGGDATERPRL